MTRPTQAKINLANLRHNYQFAKQTTGVACLAVVKADAYGHGAAAIGRALEQEVDGFAVGMLSEALELRQNGINKPVLLLQGAHERGEIGDIVANQLTMLIASDYQLAWALEANIPEPIDVWIKYDTGMHRLGLSHSEVVRAINSLNNLPWVRSLTLMTHMACADEFNHPHTQGQLVLFQQLAQQFRLPVSIANSASLLSLPQTHGHIARPGLMLYGTSPLAYEHALASQLKAVMTLEASVIALHQVQSGESVGYGATWTAQRPSVIATLSVGYGDGYPRVTTCDSFVVIRGQRAPVAGRVSMDMMCVDVTDIKGVICGDVAECWGSQVPVAHVAQQAGTLAYETLAAMPARVPRVYTE